MKAAKQLTNQPANSHKDQLLLPCAVPRALGRCSRAGTTSTLLTTLSKSPGFVSGFNEGPRKLIAFFFFFGAAV